MHQLNRSHLNYLLNRAYKKDVAAFLGVSPSTVGRWTAKDSKGNYRVKSLKTKADYSGLINDFKTSTRNTKPSRSVKEKREFFNDYKIKTKGFKRGKQKRYKKAIESLHTYYESDEFISKEIFDELLSLAQDNIDKSEPEIKAFIKLFGELSDNEETIEDYKSTDLWGVVVGGYISTANIRALIKEAQKLAFDKYTFNNISKVYIVEVKHITDKSIRPTKGEFKDGSIKRNNI